MGLASKIKTEIAGATSTGVPSTYQPQYGQQPGSYASPGGRAPPGYIQQSSAPSYNVGYGGNNVPPSTAAAAAAGNPYAATAGFGQHFSPQQQQYPGGTQQPQCGPEQSEYPGYPSSPYGNAQQMPGKATGAGYAPPPGGYPQQLGASIGGGSYQPPAPSYGMHPQYAAQKPQNMGYPSQQQMPNAGQTGGFNPYGTPGMTPHGMYPSAPPGGAPYSTGNNETVLRAKLQSIIQANNLSAFYADQSRFAAVLQKVLNVNFDAIAAQWRISKELAYDLAPLALYDIVLYCDDSGSMAFEENGERIDDLKMILGKVSSVATMFDDDGIVVRFMNSRAEGNGVKNPADVASLIANVNFSGMTPLGTNLMKKVIEPFVLGQLSSGGMAKPVLCIAITDGEPSEPKDTIMQVISQAKSALGRSPYGAGAFALEIAQVGKDTRAQQFLAKLDTDPNVGSMIDCTSGYEMEQEEYARKGINLTPELWLLKMCVGALDPEYGQADD